MTTIDLTRTSWIRRLLLSRWAQFITRLITLAGFLVAILAGLLGTRVGSHNFSIIIVWIAWWTALKLLFIPLGGRSWCSLCPIPAPGEWLQRRALLSPSGQPLGLGKRWPKALRGSWLQVGLFAALGLFSAVILTQPRATGWVLLGMILFSVALALIFERRAFCQYLCPIGGFSGLYARLSPVELRVRDAAICAAHEQKTCYTGSELGYGCPWGNFPAALKENTNCGLCMECLRACPHDNLALNLRPIGIEASNPTPARMDETWLGLVMLASALVYSALFLGPWGWLKSAAYNLGSPAWFGYALSFLAFTLGVLPALFALAVSVGKRLSKSSLSLKYSLGLFSQALLPLGLSTWIAFTVSFAFAKLSYILPVLSDPFGWGWALLGAIPEGGAPVLIGLVPVLQSLLIGGGLLWSVRLVVQYAHRAVPGAKIAMSLPVALFCLAFSASLLGLLML